jgi:predicted ATPase
MLTRIEIDGFKTFRNFVLDVTPFLVIVGQNASGKSNLFDAIRLLSRLAESDLRTAFASVRGEPADLFRRETDGSTATRITLAVEVLLDRRITDPWGAASDLTHTRLRYTVVIERRHDEDGNERLYVVDEEAVPIKKGGDALSGAAGWWLTTTFRGRRLLYGRRNALLDSRTDRAGHPVFQVHNDGIQGRPRPATAAEQTVLSTIVTAEFRHLYALRQEMRSWRFLQLDPFALRTPSSALESDQLEPDGANLAYVLHRVDRETALPDGTGSALADITADLAHLIPGVRGFDVRQNQNRQWEIWFDSTLDSAYPASVASDGTLRVLALLAAFYDPRFRGVICFEEPENGVHPARLRDLVRHLRSLVTEQLQEEASEAPLIQLVLASHSPVVLSAVTSPPPEGRRGQGVVFADVVSEIDPSSRTVSRRTRMRPLVDEKFQPSLYDGQEFPDGVVAETDVARFTATAMLED